MKLLMIFSLSALVLIGLSNGQEKGAEKPYLPCVACANEDKPVCAAPAAGGPSKTFKNSCLVLAQDCGHRESRKNINR